MQESALSQFGFALSVLCILIPIFVLIGGPLRKKKSGFL